MPCSMTWPSIGSIMAILRPETLFAKPLLGRMLHNQRRKGRNGIGRRVKAELAEALWSGRDRLVVMQPETKPMLRPAQELPPQHRPH